MDISSSNMISLNPTTNRKRLDHKQEAICIFGTGDFGRSLGMRLLKSGHQVVFGSRNPQNSTLLPSGAQVLTHADALKESSIIFLAVHRDNYDFLLALSNLLDGKVLVDVSNNLRMNQYPESNAQYLSQLLPKAIVVKGFNTVSAWALQSGSLDANSQVFICSDDNKSKQQVMDIARCLGLTPLDHGSLLAAEEVENYPLQLFPMWRLPFIITAGLTVFFFLYCVLLKIIHPYVEKNENNSYKLMVSIPNTIFPVVSLILLGLVYLPGVIAAFLQLYRGTKYKRFPDWLDKWMLCRKQLGLVSFFYGFLHVFYSLIIPLRYSKYLKTARYIIAQTKKNSTSEMEMVWIWRSDAFYASGILGFSVFCLLGITSLSTVSNAMNWREFRFVQSKLGYVTVLLCTVHTALLGWNKFLNLSRYKWGLPPIYLLSMMIPCIVLALKLILIMPCVDRMVTRIRQGWERKEKCSGNLNI